MLLWDRAVPCQFKRNLFSPQRPALPAPARRPASQAQRWGKVRQVVSLDAVRSVFICRCRRFMTPEMLIQLPAELQRFIGQRRPNGVGRATR
ncbi:unnamed protein product [Merluccius merluccius]